MVLSIYYKQELIEGKYKERLTSATYIVQKVSFQLVLGQEGFGFLLIAGVEGGHQGQQNTKCAEYEHLESLTDDVESSQSVE